MVGVGIDRVMMMIIIINKGKIGRVPKEKMEKQSNAWAVH
jgi:hypothetical protein